MDEKLILEKLVYMKELIDILESRIKKYESEKDTLEKKTLFAAMSKFSEEIVEIAIKINNILLEENNDFASSYYETFSKLEKYYTIDEDFLGRIANTTGFRNRVAHEYADLNEKITIKSFSNVVNLYLKYIEFIHSLLNKK